MRGLVEATTMYILRVSLYAYDKRSKEKNVHLTNTDLAKKLVAKMNDTDTWEGMTKVELLNFQMWNFTKLQTHLLDRKLIRNDKWLEESLRPQIRTAMAHIGRMTSQTFLKRSNTYELFGIDFILDEELNLFFIECNSGPVLEGTSKEKEHFISKMLLDHLDIMFGYLRSRTKRIVQYINQLAKELPEENIYFDGVVINDFEKKKAQFNKLNENFMEPEYEVPAGNGFFKVIDHNLQGAERYAGLIPEDCY